MSLKVLKKYLYLKYIDFISLFSMRKKADLIYYMIFNNHINWNNPRNLNEKINWLKFYSDTTLWTELADKVKVRDYVEKNGFGDTLTTVYGIWDNVDKIDLDSLPKQFVLKTNHASGDIVVCSNKDDFNFNDYKQYFRKLLKTKFGKRLVQPHYDNIKPCIFAEELLDVNKQNFESKSLIDYKIWSFNGKPEYVFICFNRDHHNLNTALYDLDWIQHNDYINKTDNINPVDYQLPKPTNFEKMIKMAETLSKGFPQVRVDLYEVDGKVYFGEMTFTSAAGYMNYFTDDFLLLLGDKCDISIL